MNKNKSSLKEGNLYNKEDQIAGSKNPSVDGLAAWKIEARRELLKQLKRSNVLNPDAVLKATFGDTLD
jgi:hypothetical protein